MCSNFKHKRFQARYDSIYRLICETKQGRWCLDNGLISRPHPHYYSHPFIMSRPPIIHPTILLLEADAAAAQCISEYVQQFYPSSDLLRVEQLADGLRVLGARRFDLVLLDLAMADSTGRDALQTVRAAVPNQDVIVLTNAQDEAQGLQSLHAGAQDYLLKDRLHPELLRRSIRYVLARHNQVARVESHMPEIERSEMLLRQVFNASVDAKLILSEDYAIRFLNPAAAQLLEAHADSLLGEVFPFGVQSGERSEFEIPAADGSTRFVELHAVDLIWQGARGLLVTLRDVSARRDAELTLHCEQTRLAVILDSVADGVIAIDPNGQVEKVNAEAVRLIGVTADGAIGQRLGEVLRLRHPQSGQYILDPVSVFLSAEWAEITPEWGIPLLSCDGQERRVTVAMRRMLNDADAPTGYVVILRDVSSEKQAEEGRFQTEQLQSISLLAGGIAHDLNNILTAVLGNLSMACLELAAGDPAANKLIAAEKAALQATSLTQQLLTFAKGGAPQRQAATIDQLVEDCAEFVLRGSNVKCEVHKDANLWPVDADLGQIGQVVNNLLINADQAMPNGGRIRLSLTCETIRGGTVASLPAGDYVCIEVADQGSGISPENLKRIFDPYFTTKRSGNGLGLASSYAIIKSHNGLMAVDSVLGEGTSFKVYLPKSLATQEPAAVVADDRIYPGEGRILVMDDMQAMMVVVGEILAVLGYEAAFATHGVEAIEAYKQAKEAGKPFDAVVFDLTVPGAMGGEEACQILREYDPNLIAVASSGYSTSNVMSEYAAAGFTAVVPKPYRIKELSAVLHRVLN